MITHDLPDGRIINSHVLDALASLPAESIQCCITSPPYYGLRKYSGDQDTQWSNGFGAYGLERTPQEWADRTLEWLRSVRRVLRKDGTVWLNVGSSYSGGEIGRHDKVSNTHAVIGGVKYAGQERQGNRGISPGYKPLDLIDPFALLYPGLLADGWYVRSVVIWAKPNPMPESVAGWFWSKHKIRHEGSDSSYRLDTSDLESLRVTNNDADRRRQMSGANPLPRVSDSWADCPGCPKCAANDGLVLRRGSWRPTSSYEYVIMLAKSASYYSDGEGVREPQSRDWSNENGLLGMGEWATLAGRNDASRTDKPQYNPAGRNLRDVWELPTQPYSGAHFATYPEELVKRCILASTPDAGVCTVCGSPWARVIDYKANYGRREVAHAVNSEPSKVDSSEWDWPERSTLGWRPTCSHSEATPATILDPFGGSGTSAVVARSLGRRFVLCELSSDYVQMGLRRLMLTQPAMVGLV